MVERKVLAIRWFCIILVVGFLTALWGAMIEGEVVQAQGVVDGQLDAATASAAATASFTYQTLTNTYKSCSAIATADIDSNGWMDVIVSSEDGWGSIRWWQNFGDSTFSMQPTISVARGGATALFGSDLDDDGDTDVAMVSSRTGQVAMFARESDTSWTFKDPLSSAYPASALAPTDVSLGRYSYLLVGVSGSNSGVYLTPFWSDTFLSQRVVLADQPSAVHAEDMDRDGDVDYLFASFYRGGIRWHAFNPGGATQSYDVAPSFTRAVWLGTADVDRDGDPDVVAASDTHGLAWWANNGDGTAWTQHLITKDEVYRGSSLALADLDADGDVDIVAGTNRELVWWENLGHPAQQHGTMAWIRHVVDASPYAASYGYAVAVADMDRDGRLDIVGCDVEPKSSSTTGRRLGWWQNRRQAVPAAGVAFMGWNIDTTLTGAWGVDLADFNGDGQLDVAASGYGSAGVTGETRLYSGTPGQPWTWSNFFSASFDDGRGLTAYREGYGRPAYVVSGDAYTGEAREFWSDTWAWTASGQAARLTGLGTAYQSAVGDLDGDGVLDIVGASASKNDIVWRNGKTGAQTVIDDSCAGARAVCLGDVDDDGLMDVGAACPGENTLIWLRQTGDPVVPWDRLASTIPFAGATDVACGDIDGDSRADLVAAQPDGVIGGMSYRASGLGGIFIWHWVTQVFTGVEHLALGDINRDGLLDVAATSPTRQEIAWFANEGGGIFSAPYIVDESAGTLREIAIGDISGDGAPDLVVASQSRNLVRWYEQQVSTDLSIDKVLDPSSTSVITAGQPISYELTVTNNGLAADVMVVDRWEPADAVIAASSDEDCVADVSQGVMTCTLSLGNGQIKPMLVALTPGLLFDGSITNTAYVLPTGPFVNYPTGPVSGTAAAVTVQRTTAIWDGRVVMGKLPETPVLPGQSFTYDLGLWNLGPKSGVTATVTNLWSPASAIGGFSFQFASGGMERLAPDARLAPDGGGCMVGDVEDGVICTFTNLAADIPITVTIGVTTTDAFTGVLEADVYLMDADGDEGFAANNQAPPVRVGSMPWIRVYLPLVLR